MRKIDIRNWIYTEFSPTTLAIAQETIDQQIDNAIRYWNTHSAHKVTAMFDYSSTDSIPLSTGIKNVVKVYPSSDQQTVLSGHPMWALLGFITLDQYTNDLMMLSNAFEGYRIYLGMDFRWKYERSDDQNVTPGRLYVQNVPPGSVKLAVVGLKWIVPDEDITDSFILDWILQYALALCKTKEGNTLRKADMIGISNDGERMLQEGLTSMKELNQRLQNESQWALFASRK